MGKSKFILVHKNKVEDKKIGTRSLFWYDPFYKTLLTFDGIALSFFVKKETYIYTDDGNTEIFKDRYNKPLTEASITTIIEYLENYKNSKEYYRRINPLLGLLKGFDCSGWNNLTVLHYGH